MCVAGHQAASFAAVGSFEHLRFYIQTSHDISIPERQSHNTQLMGQGPNAGDPVMFQWLVECVVGNNCEKI